MTKRTLLVVAGIVAAGLFAAVPVAAQQKKTLAVVVKGLDNPFFTVIGDGCAVWNTAHAEVRVHVRLHRPGSSADEAGEVQIVEDLINKGVAGIAISPSNAPAMANMLKAAAPTMPIMTIDADLPKEDAPAPTFLGTNNYDMGVLHGHASEGVQAKRRHGVPAARQRRRRQHQRTRRGLPRHDRRHEGHRHASPATAAGPRSPAARCSPTTRSPSRTSRWPTSSRQNPKLDAFVLVGGWAQFGPQAYAQVTDQVMAKLKSKALIVIAGDTLPPQLDALKAGRSHARSASGRSRWDTARRRC